MGQQYFRKQLQPEAELGGLLGRVEEVFGLQPVDDGEQLVVVFDSQPQRFAAGGGAAGQR